MGADSAALIDTGVADSPAAVLAPALAALEVDVSHIVVTHADVDHSGGLAAARALAPSALAVCHALDRPLVDSVDRMIDERYREFRHAHEIDPETEFCDWVRANDDGGAVDAVIATPAHIDLGDRRLTVLHTPGHTRGHLTVVDEATRTAIVADAVMAGAIPDASGKPAFAPTYRYVADYRASCETLRRLAPERLLCSHFAVVEGSAAVAAFLDETESFTVRLEHEIVDALAAASRPLRAVDVISRRRSSRSHLGRKHGLDARPTGRRAPRGPRGARPRSGGARPPLDVRGGRASMSRARASEELPGRRQPRSRARRRSDPGDAPARSGWRISTPSRTCEPASTSSGRPHGVSTSAPTTTLRRARRRRGSTRYAGGWQVLLPSGGGPSSHRGVDHPYHGEACSLPWTATVATDADGAERVDLRVRLADSPLLLERNVSLAPERGEVVVAERVTNEGDRPLDYMWVHHPAFGSPLVAPGARIRTSASTILADAALDGPANPLEPGTSHAWPVVATRDGRQLDVSVVPDASPGRLLLGYLSGFDEGAVSIENDDLDLVCTLYWQLDVFPYAWLWQEFGATAGAPWFGRAFTMAIEPATSFPASGLGGVVGTTATHRTLDAGAAVETELRLRLAPVEA